MFLEQRFPDNIARGSRGGPVASRLKAYAASGKLSQQFRWARPLHRYDVSHGIKTEADFEAVRALWYVVFFGGPYQGFRYRDWADYKATLANTSLQLVSGDVWQLCRRYRIGAVSFDRPIQKPTPGLAVVHRTRSGVTTPLAAAVDSTTGRVTLSDHVAGDTYAWVGEFDVPVTFQDDAMDNIALDGVVSAELLALPSIMLEEIRL